MITKTCSTCNKTKGEEEFLQRKDRPSRRSYCNDCAAVKSKKWRQDNPDRASDQSRNWREANVDAYRARQRKNHIRRTYGIEEADYQALCAEQDHACAICCSPMAEVRMVVDHDHSTGEVRGILCVTCNTGIGMLRDDYQLVQRALDYLKPDTD